MKTKVNLSRLLALGGILYASFSVASAVTPENVSMTVMPDKKIILESSIPQKLASIEIRNQETSEKVYSAKYPLAEARKTVYNLQQLPDGNYSLVLRHGNRVYEKDFQLIAGSSRLLKESTYAEPVFEQNNRKLDVAYSNLHGEKVEITFSKGTDTFFKDDIQVTNSFRRAYNLKNLESGQYFITLVSGDRTYNYDVFIN